MHVHVLHSPDNLFFAQEWSARGCKNNFLNRVSYLSNQALKNGRVFRINRNNGHSFFNGCLHNDVACNNQGFFICQRHSFA